MTVTLTAAPAGRTSDTRDTRTRETGIRWTRVTDGLWTASSAGVFLGTVETAPEGGYLAVDSRGRTVGAYTDLVAAQQVLDSPDTGSSAVEQRGRRLTAATAVIAAVASAGILLLVALDVLR